MAQEEGPNKMLIIAFVALLVLFVIMYFAGCLQF